MTADASDSSGRQTRQRVLRWVNRVLPRRYNFGNPSPPEPLPSPRPRPITSSGSMPCHQQEQSAFFSRLPLEVRRAILLYAFGNSTMHLDLTFDHPMPKRTSTNLGGFINHCGFTDKRDFSRPKQWTWRSCVCHRNPPWPLPPHSWWRHQELYRPDMDRCMRGDAPACRRRLGSGEESFRCHVGAMGWLLSCRAAYSEAIDLLYKTNQYHLSGKLLLVRLPDYILPKRLAQMSSFEVVLTLPVSTDAGPSRPSCATYASLLTMLSRCTGLKRLHLCLLYSPPLSYREGLDLSPVLDAMDAFVRATEPESIVLHTAVDALEGLEIQDGDIDKESIEAWQGQYAYQRWRCLDGDTTQAKINQRMCLYPHVLAPLRDPASPELGRSRGYWIMGIERLPMIMCNMPL